MPGRVRYSLIGVLGLSAFASIAATVRISYLQYPSHFTDILCKLPPTSTHEQDE